MSVGSIRADEAGKAETASVEHETLFPKDTPRNNFVIGRCIFWGNGFCSPRASRVVKLDFYYPALSEVVSEIVKRRVTFTSYCLRSGARDEHFVDLSHCCVNATTTAKHPYANARRHLGGSPETRIFPSLLYPRLTGAPEVGALCLSRRRATRGITRKSILSEIPTFVGMESRDSVDKIRKEVHAVAGKLSWVQALQDYFKKEPYARKIEIAEFKELTHEDKLAFAQMLRAEGYDVEDPPAPKIRATDQKQ